MNMINKSTTETSKNLIRKRFQVDRFIYVLLFFSYLIPIAIFYFSRNYFAYTNAWDEYTYLSYQGALAAILTPGYTAASLVTIILHELGISGGVQNLLWDVLVPLSLFFFGYRIFCFYSIDKQTSYFYASLLTFSSVLFNRANPIINYYSHMEIPFLAIAMEPYLSILRSPHPQLSYLAIIVFFYLYITSNKRYKFIYLLLPLPFLYWPVIFPYLLVLLVFFLKTKIFKTDTIRSQLLSNVVAVVVVGLLLYVAVLFARWSTPTFNSSVFSEENINFMISPSIIIVGFFYLFVLLLYKKYRKKLNNKFHFLYITLLFILPFLSNFQIFSRARLDPKVFQDTVGTILSSLSIILTFVTIKDLHSTIQKDRLGFRIVKYFLLVLLLILNFGSQGFSFANLNYQINASGNISSDDVKVIKEEPLKALIPDYNVSSRMTLIKAKINAPLLAYQYNYPFFVSTCSNYTNILNDAESFINQNSSSLSAEEISLLKMDLQLNLEAIQMIGNGKKNKNDVCGKAFNDNHFNLIHHNQEYMVRFPNYSPETNYYINRLTSISIAKIDYYIYGNWVPKKKSGD